MELLRKQYDVEYPDPSAGTGTRHNEGKLKWSLIDWPSLYGFVRVLMFGCKKYAPFNWQKGMAITWHQESLMRHLTASMSGEDIDPETGETHMSHIMCNAMFIEWTLKNRKDMDDRPKASKLPIGDGAGDI